MTTPECKVADRRSGRLRRHRSADRRAAARQTERVSRCSIRQVSGAPRGAVHVGQRRRPRGHRRRGALLIRIRMRSLAAEYLAAGVSVVSMSADITDVRTLVDLDDRARRSGAALIVGAAMSPGSQRPAGRSPVAAAARGRGDSRRHPRHRRPGVRRAAPRRARRHGDRLARRRLDRATGWQRSRAELVPRADRREGLLSGRPPRSVPAASNLPDGVAHQCAGVGHASRPAHRTVADADSAARRRRHRRSASRGARSRRRRCPCHRDRRCVRAHGRTRRGGHGGMHRGVSRRSPSSRACTSSAVPITRSAGAPCDEPSTWVCTCRSSPASPDRRPGSRASRYRFAS